MPFHLEPINAEGGVRITFFYDPDGTLLELVEGPLQYHEVYDRDAVEQDWALGDPERPRFDHVAETVDDLDATKEHYAKLGYDLMSGIHQPGDDRGFEINFLRHGDSSLEVFTYERAEKAQRAPQLDAPGFVAVGFGGHGETASAPGEKVGAVAGREVYADPTACCTCSRTHDHVHAAPAARRDGDRGQPGDPRRRTPRQHAGEFRA